MSGAQHTPDLSLPWRAECVDEAVQGNSRYKQWEVRDAKGGCVATIFYVTPEGEAQSKAIEARVNAHDGLVEALTDVLHNSAPPHSGDAAMDADFERRYKAATDKALALLAAIAKTTGSAS